MIITLLGSSGFGFVWGWLVAGVFASGQKTILNILLLGLATLLAVGETVWLAGWRAGAMFVGAAAIAFLIHLGWRRNLIDRFVNHK